MADLPDGARPERGPRSDDAPGGPPGERPGGPGAPLARLFGIQLLAVLAITAVLTGIFALVKGGDDSTTTALDGSTVAPAGSQSAPASSTAPAPTPTAPQPTSSPPSPTVTPPATTPAPSTSTPVRHRPEVVVFNQSAPGGSGEVAAQQLRDRGWTVFKVDNFNGNVSKTTVYYPAGLEKAAHRAAKALPGDVRIREKFSNLSDTRLTVILTDNYGG